MAKFKVGDKVKGRLADDELTYEGWWVDIVRANEIGVVTKVAYGRIFADFPSHEMSTESNELINLRMKDTYACI